MLIDASTSSASTLSNSSTNSELSRVNSRDKAEWVDTHAHLNFPVFDKDRKEVVKRCLDNNVWVVNVGTNFETSKKAVEITENYEKGMFASVGLHPINLDTELMKIRVDTSEGKHFEKEFDYEKYKELASSEKVVAIGEIGLDYYWKPKTTKKKELFKQKQKELFLEELKLARDLNLPVLFHCRMAHRDLIEVLKSEILTSKSETNSKFKIPNSQIKGVMHSFVGTIEQLREYLGMGFYIGLNGMIYKKIEGVNFEEVIENTPLNKLLIETDCPYLSPPEAGIERNEPIFVKHIAKTIAEIKKISFEKLSEITTQNARDFFDI